MKFKFYYELEISNNIYRYYKILSGSNLEKAKEKFLEYTNNKYEKPAKINVKMIHRLVEKKVIDEGEGVRYCIKLK